MATSIAVPVGEAADFLVDGLTEYAGSLTVGRTDQNQGVDLGPLIRREHVQNVESWLDRASEEGATLSLDGRRPFESPGFFLGPSVVDHVAPEMSLAREEIFGPVLSVVRSDSLEQAIEVSESSPYGNGASIFTRDGYAARRFRDHFNAGMIGINVGVPAPMAWFPFTGWNNSFFGDLHVQGMEGIDFYSRQKVTLTRWMRDERADHRDPVWREE